MQPKTMKRTLAQNSLYLSGEIFGREKEAKGNKKTIYIYSERKRERERERKREREREKESERERWAHSCFMTFLKV